MKNFKYRLEPLLKAREHIERERQKDLAAALHRVHTQREQLGQLDQNKLATFTGQRRTMTGSMSVAEMLVYSRYILKLKREALAGGEVLKVLHKEEAARREELVKASRDRKVLEKLRERQREKFDRTMIAQATKEADEIAVSSFRLKQRIADRDGSLAPGSRGSDQGHEGGGVSPRKT